MCDVVAEHIHTKQQVAIKILNMKKIQATKMTEKMKREIRILKLFRHPHIIRVYDFYQRNSNMYVVMEYAPGGELFMQIAKNGRVFTFSRNKKTKRAKYFSSLYPV